MKKLIDNYLKKMYSDEELEEMSFLCDLMCPEYIEEEEEEDN